MIEIYLLEQLAAFYGHGTLSAAAEALHLSQPSLTRSMQKIEREMGVRLFERGKNRIVLNDTGKLAAEFALRILREEEEMLRRVRNYDRSLHAVRVGSGAPGPLMLLLPRLTGMLSDFSVSSGIEAEDDLVKKLLAHEYSMIILSHPMEADDLVCRFYRKERLNISVPPFHPIASLKEVSFREADGQNFIMYARVGIWDRIVREKMPHSRFYLQNDFESLGELTRYSELPSFSTDITTAVDPSRRNGRVHVPVSDPEATVSFYIITGKQADGRLGRILDRICQQP